MDHIAHVAFYGTLMRGLGGPQPADWGAVTHMGPCRIRGQLVDLGAYPGLIPADDAADTVVAELCRIEDHSVLAALDQYEGYQPADPEGSLYLRTAMPLIDPRCTAWVYVYNRFAGGAAVVPRGDWRGYTMGDWADAAADSADRFSA